MRKIIKMSGLGWRTPQPVGVRWDAGRRIFWIRLPCAQIGLRIGRRAW